METEHENSRDLYNIYFMVDVSPLTQLPPTAKPGRPQPSIGLCFNDLRFSISFDRQKHWAGFPKPGHIYFSLPEIPYSACRMLMFCKTSHRASPHLPSYFCSFILFMIRGPSQNSDDGKSMTCMCWHVSRSPHWHVVVGRPNYLSSRQKLYMRHVLACTGTDRMLQCRIDARVLVVLDFRPVPS